MQFEARTIWVKADLFKKPIACLECILIRDSDLRRFCAAEARFKRGWAQDAA